MGSASSARLSGRFFSAQKRGSDGRSTGQSRAVRSARAEGTAGAGVATRARGRAERGPLDGSRPRGTPSRGPPGCHFPTPGGLGDGTCPEGCQMRGARSGTGGARGRTSKFELLVGVNLEAVRHLGRRSRAGSLASSASVREFVASEGRAACRKGTSRSRKGPTDDSLSYTDPCVWANSHDVIGERNSGSNNRRAENARSHDPSPE